MHDVTLKSAHCNHCGGHRNHEVMNKIDKSWNEDVGENYQISGRNLYTVLECRGCESVKILHQSWFSEETDENNAPLMTERYYPTSIFRPHPPWLWQLDKLWHITKLLKEIYKALQNDAPSLAAMGIRAVIEAIMIDKVGDQKTFSANLKAFQGQGYISTFQLGILEVALEIGHATIHRGLIPDKDHLEIALDTVENLVHSLYLLEDRAKATGKRIPKRGA